LSVSLGLNKVGLLAYQLYQLNGYGPGRATGAPRASGIDNFLLPITSRQA